MAIPQPIVGSGGANPLAGGSSGSYDITQDPNYQAVLQALQGNMPGATQANLNTYGQQQQQNVNDFISQYQNFVGAAPDQSTIAQFINQFIIPNTAQLRTPGSQIEANVPNAIQQFIGQNFQQQANQKAQTTAQNQLTGELNQIPGIVNTQTQALTSQLTNPNSPEYQQFAGLLNNMGITPSSGAFQSALGGTIGQGAAQDISTLLGNVAQTGLVGQQGLSSLPYTTAMSNIYPSQGAYNEQSYNLENFGLESQLAQQLAQMSQPSTAQQDIGMASAAANAVPGFGRAVGATSQITWICTAMWRDKVLAACEVDRLHKHLFRAMLKRPFKFLGYLLFGKLAVWWAESYLVNWEEWRPMFYDRVIAETDPVIAVDLYADAFWKLVSWCREGKCLNLQTR